MGHRGKSSVITRAKQIVAHPTYHVDSIEVVPVANAPHTRLLELNQLSLLLK